MESEGTIPDRYKKNLPKAFREYFANPAYFLHITIMVYQIIQDINEHSHVANDEIVKQITPPRGYLLDDLVISEEYIVRLATSISCLICNG